MKATFVLLFLTLMSNTLAFSGMRKLPSMVIDTSFLKTSESVKKPSFAQLTAVMKQFRDVSQVNEFLDSLLADVAANRAENLAIIEQSRAQCEEEASFRAEEILEGQRSADASQAQLNLCNGQQDQAERLNELATNALSVDQNALEQLNENRVAEIALFNERTQRLNTLNDNIRALEGFLDAYEFEDSNSLTNAQFIQTTNSLLKTTIATGHSHLVLPMYTKLLQMHAKQNVRQGAAVEDIEAIRAILNEITEDANEEIQRLAQEDAEHEQRFEERRDLLQNLINKLSNQVSHTQAFVALMDQCIASETSINQLSENKVENNQGLLESAQSLCAASEDKWRVSELSRSREVNIINALKGAVSRIAQENEQNSAPRVGDLISLKMF